MVLTDGSAGGGEGGNDPIKAVLNRLSCPAITSPLLLSLSCFERYFVISKVRLHGNPLQKQYKQDCPHQPTATPTHSLRSPWLGQSDVHLLISLGVKETNKTATSTPLIKAHKVPGPLAKF